MCGIVGYSGFHGKSLNKGIEGILLRGPDDHGAEYFKNVALGSTRLAIIDLSSKGHQPMFSDDKSFCITFNGEIYNYKEIKKDLERKYKFKSNSDTEVILYAYKEWGANCLQKLNGMFAFVIYDRKNDLLFGARDRLGQKPLKYYFKDGKFVFASEIKAILNFLNLKPSMDKIAIDNFLTLQYIPSPQTGFEDICKLPAGSYFIYKDSKLVIEKYWSMEFGKKRELSEEKWQEAIYEGLNEAVKLHLVSDVPVGALLSGGLDSSLIVALMSKNYEGKINTFNVKFDDAVMDESHFARIVAKKYNTRHFELKVGVNDFTKNISDLARFYDEPLADNSILPTYMISKLASSKVKVALAGDGGDENFAGYDRYDFVKLADLFRNYPHVLKQALIKTSKTSFNIVPNKFTERSLRFTKSLEEDFWKKYMNYNCFFTNEVKHSLYRKEFIDELSKNNTFNLYKGLYSKKLDSLDNALKIDINTYLPDDLLYKTDIASMSSGLELRSPFLDYKFMEKMAEVPSYLKLKGKDKKKILKDMAVRYDLLPKEIVYRKKHGFNIPQNVWFKGALNKFLKDNILSNELMYEIFDRNELEKYVSNYANSKLNYDNNIFALLMLSLWLQKYFI